MLKADGFDDAVIGVAHRAGGMEVLAYDMGKVIEILQEQGLDLNDAREHFWFNIAGAYVGNDTPVFIDMMSFAEMEEICDTDAEESEVS